MTHEPVFMERIFTLRRVRSMGAAALVEILIAFGIAGALIWQRLQPEVTQPPVVISDPFVVPDPHPPIPRTAPTPDRPQTPHLAEVPSIPTDISGPNVRPVEPPHAPIMPSQPTADLDSQFEASMLRAINSQKLYPRVSLLKAETGEVVVSFDYVNGAVSNIRVERSSGSHELDQAAIDAVKKAALPMKPAELARLTHFEFTLLFDLGG